MNRQPFAINIDFDQQRAQVIFNDIEQKTSIAVHFDIENPQDIRDRNIESAVSDRAIDIIKQAAEVLSK